MKSSMNTLCKAPPPMHFLPPLLKVSDLVDPSTPNMNLVLEQMLESVSFFLQQQFPTKQVYKHELYYLSKI